MENSETDHIGILKTIWRRGDNGAWAGHDLQGIDLKPREGFDKDYFKIQNEMVLMTQRLNTQPDA